MLNVILFDFDLTLPCKEIWHLVVPGLTLLVGAKSNRIKYVPCITNVKSMKKKVTFADELNIEPDDRENHRARYETTYNWYDNSKASETRPAYWTGLGWKRCEMWYLNY